MGSKADLRTRRPLELVIRVCIAGSQAKFTLTSTVQESQMGNKRIHIAVPHQPHQMVSNMFADILTGWLKGHRIISAKPGSITALYQDIVPEAANITTINIEETR